MPDVICLGELLIDMCAAEPDVSLANATRFTKAPGGAPANVAVGVARLGASCGFIGAVGQDPFGAFLLDTLEQAGVNVAQAPRVADARTSIAFIASRSDGAKDIAFWRNPGADQLLTPDHVNSCFVQSAEAFHFGSISRIDAGPRNATDFARSLASETGAMISYDPNWRPSLWPDASAARDRLRKPLADVHVAKISEEEWEFVTGCDDFARGAAMVLQRGTQLVVRSEGPAGASFATATASGHVDGFAVDCVEPTGAGDGMMACLIVELLAHWRQGAQPASLPAEELDRIVGRANAVGALACTRVGAIPSLPTRDQLDAFLAQRS